MRRSVVAATGIAVAGLAALVTVQARAADQLVIESWRNDDLSIWQDKIIPAFTKTHPDIQVTFSPSPPAEYNAALNAKLDGGTAGDIITCRPFDASLAMFKKGQLVSLNDLPGMDHFSATAKAGWSTDDGKITFCVPMASVIHGFMYNEDAFKDVGVSVPKTESEFFDVLAKIKASGKYVPLDIGTADQWEAATMGFQNIGPDYWQGEAGRKALIDGTEKFTDKPYVETFEELAKWKPYLADGYQAQKYPDSQNLFTLGRAAVYPAGSWDISTFRKDAQFPIGAFPPPVPDGQTQCYISDHPDIAMGINAKTRHMQDAKTFLAWVATPEFASLYSNALPGFFTLQDTSVTLTDPLAQTFVSWRKICKGTMRDSYQILSRGTPNLENQLWDVSAQVLNGTMTPAVAAQTVQKGLDSWYKPAVH